MTANSGAISSPHWHRRQFPSIEAMAASVQALRPDRQWRATQLSRGVASGRVVALHGEKAVFTATELEGTVEVRGVLSEDRIVIGLGLSFPAGVRQWYQPGVAGMLLLATPGSCHNGLYIEHSSYISMDISEERLRAEAELAGIMLERDVLAGSRIMPGQMDARWMRRTSAMIGALHEGREPQLPPGARLEEIILAGLISHLGRKQTRESSGPAAFQARQVQRACDYIDAGIKDMIHIDDLCRAARCSRSALFRAFAECLGESPQAYVLKLRLNRIRQELAGPLEAARTVTTVSNKWGIAELGRLAGRYREQFGETPSETLRRRGAALPAA